MNELQTIRGALNDAIESVTYWEGYYADLMDGYVKDWEKALTALDTLAAEPSEDARELAKEIASYDPGCCSVADIAAALITARDKCIIQKVREECANEIWDRVNRLFTDQDAAFWKEIEIWSKITGPQVKSAITGAK
jgi:hypothetical protein